MKLLLSLFELLSQLLLSLFNLLSLLLLLLLLPLRLPLLMRLLLLLLLLLLLSTLIYPHTIMYTIISDTCPSRVVGTGRSPTKDVVAIIYSVGAHLSPHPTTRT